MDNDDLFQPLTYVGTIKRSFRLYFDHFDALLNIHCLAFLSCLCLDCALRIITGADGQFVDAVMYLAAWIGIVVIDGAVYHMVAKVYLGEATGSVKSMRAAWKGSKWTLLGFNMLLKYIIIESTPGPLNLVLHLATWKKFSEHIDASPDSNTDTPPPKFLFHLLTASFGIMMEIGRAHV